MTHGELTEMVLYKYININDISCNNIIYDRISIITILYMIFKWVVEVTMIFKIGLLK